MNNNTQPNLQETGGGEIDKDSKELTLFSESINSRLDRIQFEINAIRSYFLRTE